MSGLTAALSVLGLRSAPAGADASTDAPAGAPSAAAAAVRWLVLFGVLIGLCWVGVFRFAWRVFGDPEMTRVRLAPALAVVLLESCVTGAALFRGMAGVAAAAARDRGESDPQAPAVHAASALALVLLSHFVLIASFPERIGWYAPAEDWRSWFNPFYPLVTYRPLLLAPIWGRWGILLAAGVGRPISSADPLTRAFCAAAQPAAALGWVAPPFLLTALYANREGLLLHGLMIGLIVLLAGYLTALWLARRLGGQSRHSLLACGAVTQLVFLAAFRVLCI